MILVKALIALVIAAVVYAIGAYILRHFGIDVIWAFIVAAIAGLWYFFSGPEVTPRI